MKLKEPSYVEISPSLRIALDALHFVSLITRSRAEKFLTPTKRNVCISAIFGLAFSQQINSDGEIEAAFSATFGIQLATLGSMRVNSIVTGGPEMRIHHDKTADVLMLVLRDVPPANAIEEAGGVIISYGKDGVPTTIEFLRASKRMLLDPASPPFQSTLLEIVKVLD